MQLKITVVGKVYEVDVEAFEPEPPHPSPMPTHAHIPVGDNVAGGQVLVEFE